MALSVFVFEEEPTPVPPTPTPTRVPDPTATSVPIVSYEHYSLQSDGNGYFNASLGCEELVQNPFYSLRNSVLGFQVGDQLWTNSSRTAYFNGNGYWYQVGDLFQSSAQKVIKIGEGQIMQIENCPTVAPTPTPTAVSSGAGAGVTPDDRPIEPTPVVPTATPAATSQNCEEWTLYGGSPESGTGRSFTFTRCGYTEPITLNIPAGDSTTECIVMPWNGATGAVREFISCSGGPNPTPIATEAVYVYLMDPCDGVSQYVVAKTNEPKSIGGVWDLTGSLYVDTNPYTIIATSTEPFETTIADGHASCPGDDGGDKCLLAGTMITLADGTQRAIETIVAGNELKSMVIGDMPDGDNYEVLKVWSQASPTVSNTTTIVQNNTMSNVDSVLSFNGGRLTSSKDHLHIIKRNNNWMVIKASTIVTGDIFIDESAQEIVINSIQELTGTFSVYKLDVETNDTFIANGIITHNSKPLP